ncbi:AraC family transcriptional regulator [Lentzea sp. NPDC051838]|uniref:helix-turn-helix transcriptional regulator n=1 Tax=Lentzea sp. NPDC051838 TaxID=3154849 RepID=UPI003423BBBF
MNAVWRRSGDLPLELPYPSVDLLVFADGTLWLSGPETVARTGRLTQPLTGVHLKPGTCADVLGLAADEVPLGGMRIPDESLRALRGPAGAGDSVVRQVIRAIHADPGAPLSSHVVGLSPRQLRRRFQVAVGLSPKAYARVVRLHRAMALAREAAPDWASVAVRAGFYDQPHMLAEFRRAVGMSCVRFFQSTTAASAAR